MTRKPDIPVERNFDATSKKIFCLFVLLGKKVFVSVIFDRPK